jgi:capsular polysaccharide export protein
MTTPATFLFLQGVASPLFARLADELELRGHRCLRINFCAGDSLFWRRPGATSYRGRYDEWPAFVEEFLDVNGVTDLILFGDNRPLHRLAIAAAGRRGTRRHIFEEGYLRPYCITLEADGTNAASKLPRSAEDFVALGAGRATSAPPVPVPISMFRRAAWDVANHTLNTLLQHRHPYYQSHRPHHPLHELRGWSRRIIRRHFLGERRRHAERLDRFLTSEKPFFLVPLQLDTDSQITVHSDFRDLGEFLETVMASFVRHAPAGTFLIVKCHPLDNDLVPREAQTMATAKRHGISSRVLFVDGGHLPTLLAKARGLITVNSTIATSAFDHGCPVKVLGRALYDFAGLTARKTLAEFWWNPEPPDPAVVCAFRTVLLDRCLVRGSFYSREGIDLAIDGAVRLIEERWQLALSPGGETEE